MLVLEMGPLGMHRACPPQEDIWVNQGCGESEKPVLSAEGFFSAAWPVRPSHVDQTTLGPQSPGPAALLTDGGTRIFPWHAPGDKENASPGWDKVASKHPGPPQLEPHTQPMGPP